MAQAVLQDQAGQQGVSVQVDSAGISNEEQGNYPDPRAIRVLEDAGYEVPDHRARQITKADFEDFDLMLAMTTSHLRALERLKSQIPSAKAQLRLYTSFDPASTDPDVPDPWYGDISDFFKTLDTIENVTPQLLEFVEQQER